MKKLFQFYLLLFFFCFSLSGNTQCNTNVTICTPGEAGPFNFIPASNNPSSCLFYAAGATASNYAYIILYISQGGDLNLLIDGDNNTGFIDLAIYDITGETNPCSVLGSSMEIVCYGGYSSAANVGCNQLGNDFPCSSTLPAPTVNTGDVIMILLEDYSSAQSNFTLELGTSPGSAQTGPPDATISPVGPFLDTDSPVILNTANGGGAWSSSCGSCIDPLTGEFDPVAAGVGTHQICYDIGFSPCSDNDCIDVAVVYDCTVPTLDPIADIEACDSYILPPITGSDLTGNEAFFTGVGGTGTQYNVGDIYNTNGTQTLYAYSEEVVLSKVCADETTFDISIDSDNPIISCPNNLTAICEISEQPPYANYNEFLAAGGMASDVTGTIDPTSFTLLSEVSDGNTCPETTTRTYQILDDCGHTSTCTQEIVIDDLIHPTGNPPADLTVQCPSNIPAIDLTSFTNLSDNCTTNPTVTHVSDVSDGNTCPDVITRTYNIADDCGNNIDVVQTITINDDINPTGTAPADLTVQCIGDVPAADVTLITDEADNCTVNPIVTHVSDVSDGNTCPEVITRTYNIADDCGNNIDVVQTITINDDINPTGTAPADLTVQCIGDVPAADVTLITDEADNCTVNPIVTHVSDVSDGNTCPEVITRTYNIADDCGNNIDVVQTITINDDINPTGTAPADLTVQCVNDVPAADISSLTNVSDNCTANPTVTHVSDVSDGNTCPEIITRTYNIADDCGNNIDVVQSITIIDDINPTGNAPADLTVQCINDVPASDISSLTNVSDNCTTSPTVTHVSDVSDGNTCPEIITRTYNIADDCGNDIDVTQTITIEDDIAPTASNPATISVDCLGDVPIVDPSVVIDAADNCTSIPIVDFVSESSDGNTCNGEEITRIYSITDDCGNSIERSQIIVVDVYTPSFTLSSTDPSTCDGTDGSITLSGLNPSTDYDLSYNNGQTNLVTTNNNGEYIISGLSEGSYDGFTIADGNCPTCSKTVNTIISLEDPLPPVVEAGPDVEICEEETVILNAFNPDNANLSWSNGVSDGVGFIPPLGTTSYIVTAELVNCFSFDTVEVTVNPLPIVSAGNDIEVCEDEQVTLTGTGNAAIYSWNNGVADGVAFGPSLGTTTYTVTGVSAFGCEESDDVELTVLPKPDVDFVANVTEVCAPEEVLFMNQTIGDIAECKYTINGTTQILGCDVSNVFSQAGCYDVNLEVELQNGCKEDLTLVDYICIDDYPVADFSVLPKELSTFKNEAKFNNKSLGASTYYWDFGDTTYGSQINPEHEYDVNNLGKSKAKYRVELFAYSDLGCVDSAFMYLPYFEDLIYFVPNSFTPDGNKYNETFKPVFTSGFDPQEYSLKIYNRWGQIIFESRNAEIGWDGTYGVKDNSIVPVGTYVWRIDFKKSKDDERKQITGHVNLLK